MSQAQVARLAGRRIVLGVSGGIAAYKSAELTRRLCEWGAEVQVVMTRGAEHFIGAAALQAVSGRPVRDSLWDAQAEAAMGHIELARWPDLVLIAPATADVIARLAQGRADDLLTTLVLASDKPLAIAPAMNRLMWSHPATRDNVATLTARSVNILGPGAGAQACGEVGEGRMREPTDIRADVANILDPQGPLSGHRVVITAGPTREAIDPVRFITNRSSGKQGYAVAQAFRNLGANVTLISGPTQLDTPMGVSRIEVETAAQMCETTLAESASADILVGTAAVADYRVAEIAPEKIKKNDADMRLDMIRNADILKTVRAAHPTLFMVGFAAETEKLETHAKDKLTRKKLNMIAANQVGNGRAFDQDDNQLSVYWPDGSCEIPKGGKQAVANALANLIAERFATNVRGS